MPGFRALGALPARSAGLLPSAASHALTSIAQLSNIWQGDSHAQRKIRRFAHLLPRGERKIFAGAGRPPRRCVFPFREERVPAMRRRGPHVLLVLGVKGHFRGLQVPTATTAGAWDSATDWAEFGLPLDQVCRYRTASEDTRATATLTRCGRAWSSRTRGD